MQTRRISPPQPVVAATPGKRPDYLAAVRHYDGRRELFCIRNADSLADARALVLSEVVDLQGLVIALRH
jgi:hypothetical protein